ncbi:MAG: cyclase family protein [Candidatus Methylomirabilales bacterium]
MRIFDISRPLRAGMPVYPGDPEYAVQPWLSVSRGDPVNVSVLTLGSHTGTHLDAPRHLRDAGAGVDALPLEALLGPALVVDLGRVPCIDAPLLRRTALLDLGGHARLLLRTRALAGGSAGLEHPGLTPDAAALLVEAEVRLLGIEGLSVDPPGASDLAAHRLLLGAGVIIAEGLDLSAVPAGEYELACLPLRLCDGDGAPARAVLVAPDGARRPARRAGARRR